MDRVIEEIKNAFCETDVLFTVDLLNEICNLFALADTKLKEGYSTLDTFPKNSTDAFFKAKKGDRLAAIAFIYWRNPAVRKNIEFVFPTIGK